MGNGAYCAAWLLLIWLVQPAMAHLQGVHSVTMLDTDINATASSNNSSSSSTSGIENTPTMIFNAAGHAAEIGAGVIAAAAMVLGLAISLVGYRLFRPTIFVYGFLGGGVLASRVMEQVLEGRPWLLTVSWIGFFTGGILGGAIVLSLYTAGIFVAGAAGGVVLAEAFSALFATTFYPSNPSVFFVVSAVVMALVGGFLTLRFEKPMLIVTTSILGSGLLLWGIGYYAGEFPSGTNLRRFQESGNQSIVSIPAAWWGYLVALITTAALSTYVQFHKTGADEDFHLRGREPKVPASRLRSQRSFGTIRTPQERRSVQRSPSRSRSPRYDSHV